MFTAIPIQFISYLYYAATFQSPEGARLIEDGLYCERAHRALQNHQVSCYNWANTEQDTCTCIQIFQNLPRNVWTISGQVAGNPYIC